jgi:formylglycine-generating enzyme required for sulfatase activity
MNQSALLLLLALGACSSKDGQNEDSGPSDSNASVNECAPEGQPSGLAVGVVDCEAGRCVIPSGSFWRGQARGDADACPLHQVELNRFEIDQKETTRDDYLRCVQEGECTQSAPECESIYSSWAGNADALPIVCVTYAQAENYCEWAGGRLPTEAEWEKAARGSQGAVFPWGERAPLCEDANFRFVSWYCNPAIVEVGDFPESPSAFGLLDTLGNVWEWTADYYDASWYWDADRINPSGPEQCALDLGAERGDCTLRVIRGGGFNSTERQTRGSSRSMAAPDRLDINMGFRCAYDSSDFL